MLLFGILRKTYKPKSRGMTAINQKLTLTQGNFLRHSKGLSV